MNSPAKSWRAAECSSSSIHADPCVQFVRWSLAPLHLCTAGMVRWLDWLALVRTSKKDHTSIYLYRLHIWVYWACSQFLESTFKQFGRIQDGMALQHLQLVVIDSHSAIGQDYNYSLRVLGLNNIGWLNTSLAAKIAQDITEVSKQKQEAVWMS